MLRGMTDVMTSASDPAARFAGPTLEELVARPAWHRDALCREYPGLDWFPDRHPSTEVVAVCSACLVNRECLAAAMAGFGERGVWAGTTERERKRLRRDRRDEAA